MDRQPMHAHDTETVASSETHRLPTISASQALDGLESEQSNCISTGLDSLDKILGDNEPLGLAKSRPSGGIKRGQVTDIWGPPGAGKTALGIQLVANALCEGGSVVWVDCFHAAPTQRIAKVVDALTSLQQPKDREDIQNRGIYTRYQCLTLPHLMALIGRPTKDSIRESVSLVVISSLTALLNSSLPKSNDNKTAKGQAATAKRLKVLQHIITGLQKLAATRNCAVVLLSQCATRMQSERSAALVPAVNATVWELGIATRLAVYKDWVWQDSHPRSASIARVQKLDGKILDDETCHISAFQVESTGVTSVQHEIKSSLPVSGFSHQKRKLALTGLEVPDSEDDEDYEWGDEDETAISPPPRRQWQGSEDVLLGVDVGHSEAGTESEENQDEDGGADVGIVGGEAQSEADAGLGAGEAPSPRAVHPK